jgi:hypothetical protein
LEATLHDAKIDPRRVSADLDTYEDQKEAWDGRTVARDQVVTRGAERNAIDDDANVQNHTNEEEEHDPDEPEVWIQLDQEENSVDQSVVTFEHWSMDGGPRPDPTGCTRYVTAATEPPPTTLHAIEEDEEAETIPAMPTSEVEANASGETIAEKGEGRRKGHVSGFGRFFQRTRSASP